MMDQQNKLWLEGERKVFLSEFSDARMKDDSVGKDSWTEDFYRFKTYTKDKDKLLGSRDREFQEPYQVAQRYLGGTWNDYNVPFIVQVGQCNINCVGCFVSDDLKNCQKGAYFSASDVIDMCIKAMKKLGKKRCILRISGGEPFLAPDFLIDIGNSIKKNRYFYDDKKWHVEYNLMNYLYLWLDTNLLGHEYKQVVNNLNDVYYGICGCFKGLDVDHFREITGLENKVYSKQFTNTREILYNMEKTGHGELFFYVPELLNPALQEKNIRSSCKNFIDRLKIDVHDLAPLRVTVLHWKKYGSNEHRFPEKRLPTGTTQRIWNECIVDEYGIDLAWLPQYQIDLHERQ